jgi:putative Mn2+ efflux pump MntP
MFLGKKIGCKLVRWAGLIAGIVFIAIGLKILLEGIL